jgi:hypothetical protein
MPKYLKPGVYSSNVDYSLYTPKQRLKDFVNTQNAGYSKTKTIKAKWTIETKEQLKALQSLAPELILVNELAKQMRESIDKEIMKGLYNASFV